MRLYRVLVKFVNSADVFVFENTYVPGASRWQLSDSARLNFPAALFFYLVAPLGFRFELFSLRICV